MVRLVHPAPAGNGPPAPKRRKGSHSPTLFLSDDEVRHFRAALLNAARAYGGMDVLASAMSVPVERLYDVTKRRNPSGTLAIRLAAAAGTTVEAVLSGTLADAGKCPSCGRKAGAA